MVVLFKHQSGSPECRRQHGNYGQMGSPVYGAFPAAVGASLGDALAAASSVKAEAFPGPGQPSAVPSPPFPRKAAQWYPHPDSAGSAGPILPQEQSSSDSARMRCSCAGLVQPKRSSQGIWVVQEGPSPGELRDGMG